MVRFRPFGSDADGEVTAAVVKARLGEGADLLLLDVRQPEEYRSASISGALHIPLDELPGRLGELDREHDIVVYCHSGSRSALACRWLRRAGFAKVRNLAGGIVAWSATTRGGA